MILVTLGTIPYPYDRLIDWISITLDKGLISEPIFVQYGTTDVSSIINHPLVTATALLSIDEIGKIISNSRLVISHAGQGSTRKLAKTNKPFIIIPRESKYGEHIDNHQLHFAQNMSKEFGICCCTSLAELQNCFSNPPLPINKELFSRNRLAKHLLTIFPPDCDNPNTQIKANYIN